MYVTSRPTHMDLRVVQTVSIAEYFSVTMWFLSNCASAVLIGDPCGAMNRPKESETMASARWCIWASSEHQYFIKQGTVALILRKDWNVS